MATNRMGVYDTFNLTHENVLDLHIVNSVYLIAIISHATYVTFFLFLELRKRNFGRM